MNIKTKPTQYGPTRNRLTKQQGLQLRGPAELAAGDLISPAAACRILNDNAAGLYVAESRISSWISEKLIPSQSYTARDGRTCSLLFSKHVDYLKELLIRISTEEPTKRGETETRKPAEPAAPAPRLSKPACPACAAPGQQMLQLDASDPAAAAASAVFAALNVHSRLETLEKRVQAVAEAVSEQMKRIELLCKADEARRFAFKELWEQVADLRKELDARRAAEEADRAERIEALEDEARELISA